MVRYIVIGRLFDDVETGAGLHDPDQRIERRERLIHEQDIRIGG
jgi:hypothetical protein